MEHYTALSGTQGSVCHLCRGCDVEAVMGVFVYLHNIKVENSQSQTWARRRLQAGGVGLNLKCAKITALSCLGGSKQSQQSVANNQHCNYIWHWYKQLGSIYSI